MPPVPNPQNGYVPQIGERVRVVGGCHPDTLGRELWITRIHSDDNDGLTYYEGWYEHQGRPVYTGGLLGGLKPARLHYEHLLSNLYLIRRGIWLAWNREEMPSYRMELHAVHQMIDEFITRFQTMTGTQDHAPAHPEESPRADADGADKPAGTVQGAQGTVEDGLRGRRV